MVSQLYEDTYTSYSSMLQEDSDVPLESSTSLSQLSTDQDGGSRLKRGYNFTINEDKLLVSAWLNTSLDPIGGTDMKLGGFWKKVESYFNDAKESNGPIRSDKSLSNRWSTIQHDVNKFCGYLSQVERMQRSGVSKEDNIQAARKMFQELHKHPFKYDHCWDLLKFEQKWITRGIFNAPQKRKAPTPCSSNKEPVDGIEDIQDLNEINGNQRPSGRKAAKERKKLNTNGVKDSVTSALSEYKEEKKKAHEDKMSKYDLSTEIQNNQLLATEEGNRIKKEKFNFEQSIKTEKFNFEQSIKKEKLNLEQSREDREIMMTDTSSMSDAQRKYFEFRQMQIRQRMNNLLPENSSLG